MFVLILPLVATALAACQPTVGQSARYQFEYEPKIPVALPAHAPSISQQFRKSATPGESKDHLAIDVVAPKGTPVLAAAPGTVTRVQDGPIYGKRVEITHGTDAQGRIMHTRYFHLDSQTVVEGQKVARGAQVGTLGHSGMLAGTLDHLHFSVLRNRETGPSEFVDPNAYWIKGPGLIECFSSKRRYKTRLFGATYPVQCAQ